MSKERLSTWWLLKESKFNAQLNVPNLLAYGWRRKTSFSPPYIFHPKRFLLKPYSH
jgi:hypothetical protein